MKPRRLISCVLGGLSLLSSSLLSQTVVLHEIHVGTAAVPNLREVTWGPRTSQASGTWGVSSESFRGFTLTSLFDGIEASALAYDSSARTLGVFTSGFGSAGRINYRSTSPLGREGVQLTLPAAGALVGVPDGPDQPFAGIRQITFDRLNNGNGNIVTITGFAADPLASWAVAPGMLSPLSYNAVTNTLTFTIGTSANGWGIYGVLEFANLEATASPTGVALVFSNDLANNNNSYGLVGWQYAVIPETATTATVFGGAAALGLLLTAARRVRQRRLR